MPELPPGIGPYEKWPGFHKVRERLERFLAVLAMSDSAFFTLMLRFPNDRRDQFRRIVARKPQLVVPKDKREFHASGLNIRLSFGVEHDDSLAFLKERVGGQFTKHAIAQAILWAHSGPSNNVSCIYNVEHLNTHMLPKHPELAQQLCVSCLDEGRYEIGFDTHGNIFDALLYSDEILRSSGMGPGG